MGSSYRSFPPRSSSLVNLPEHTNRSNSALEKSLPLLQESLPTHLEFPPPPSRAAPLPPSSPDTHLPSISEDLSLLTPPSPILTPSPSDSEEPPSPPIRSKDPKRRAAIWSSPFLSTTSASMEDNNNNIRQPPAVPLKTISLDTDDDSLPTITIGMTMEDYNASFPSTNNSVENNDIHLPVTSTNMGNDDFPGLHRSISAPSDISTGNFTTDIMRNSEETPRQEMHISSYRPILKGDEEIQTQFKARPAPWKRLASAAKATVVNIQKKTKSLKDENKSEDGESSSIRASFAKAVSLHKHKQSNGFSKKSGDRTSGMGEKNKQVDGAGDSSEEGANQDAGTMGSGTGDTQDKGKGKATEAEAEAEDGSSDGDFDSQAGDKYIASGWCAHSVTSEDSEWEDDGLTSEQRQQNYMNSLGITDFSQDLGYRNTLILRPLTAKERGLDLNNPVHRKFYEETEKLWPL